MRKYIIFTILLSCLHFSARGQTIASLDDIDLSGLPQPTTAKALRYWFDDDGGSVKTVNQLKGKQTLDVSALIDGLHTVHYQVIDNNNAVASVSSAVFIKVGSVFGAVAAKSLRYWFDDDANSVVTTTKTSGTFTINTASLIDGLHTIHYQVIGADNTPYYISSGIFMKMTDNAGAGTITATKLMYWFDDETDVKQVSMTDGMQMLDASMLTEGLHTIHYQALCSNGDITPAKSSIFMRMNVDTETATAKSLRYWFDDESSVTETAISSGVQMIDASRLLDGLHTVHYQIVDSKDMAGIPVSSVFMKMNATASTQAKQLRYWFDDDAATVQVVSVSKGTQTLNVSSLLTGLHTLNYQLIDSEGKLGVPVTRMFFKDFDRQIAEGENRITKYQYWLNTNSATMQTVELSNASNPYQLITLLPMQKEPIHSDCFHFEVTDDQPTIYAKNIFHIRFHDAAGYFADGDKPFVDYNVKQEVTDIEWLKSGVRATTAKPAENAIKWYCLDAEPGDSVQFKLDKAATIQLFSPSGEKVFSTSGSESVSWGGCHAKESGTYYLALHDVTAQYGNTISIDYNHIDKYAVLRQDVTVVGNGGFSSITFEGNGFRDLYAVDLYTEGGDTIKSSAIRHTSDAIVSVLFDFTDKRTCSYNGLFHFTTEDRHYHNMVTVEEAKEIELALDIKYPNTFLRGTSTTYTIKVTNKGNSTAFNIPMEIYLSADDSFANIESVKFRDELGKEFNNLTFNKIDNDSIDEETLEYINETLREFKGLQTFIVKNDSTNGSNYGFTDQLLTIPPNSSTTFYMEIKSSSTVDLKVRIPSDWITIQSQREIAASRNNRNVFKRDWCCEKEKWECTAKIVFNIAGMVPIAGCASGVLDIWYHDVFEILCTDGIDLKDKIDNFCFSFSEDLEKHKSYLWRGVNDLIGCILGKIGKKIAELAKELIPLKKARITTLANHKNAYDSFIKKQNNANWCKSEAQKAFKEGKYEVYQSLMDDYDKYMKEAEELERLASTYWQEYQNLGEQIFKIEQEIDHWKKELQDIIGAINNAKNALSSKSDCYKAWTKAKTDCPHNPDEKDGKSSPVNSADPNEIFGYSAESGSLAVKDGLRDVYYTIQFENDTTFATASAHDIYLTDTLDTKKFDLSTFAPTRVKIGSKSAELTGEPNSVTTVDMRPEINAIAQVESSVDQKKGIVSFHISSLDPMTMEPTKYLMDGVLPVNYDGSGLGEVSFDIQLRDGLKNGTEIPNRAGIVFDNNDVIMTPTWTNIVDRIPPVSRAESASYVNDSTVAVSINASDNLSGPWRYDVYVQYDSGAWFLAAENVPMDSAAHVRTYKGITHRLYTVCTDEAGNVERKQQKSELSIQVSGGVVTAVDTLPEKEGEEETESGDVYDLQGRKSNEAQAGKGIIIKNRKKVAKF